MLQLFVNSLSIPDEDCALEVAVGRLKSLVLTLRAAGKVRRRYVVNADRPLAELSLGRGRPLAALRNEAIVTEERVYLKTVFSRSPWTTALATLPEDDAGGPEYRLPSDAPTMPDCDATALGLAHDVGGLAISIPTHDHWRRPTVEVERTTLNAEAETVVARLQTPNASEAAHVEHHAEKLRAASKPSIGNGAELWARRGELLPNLRFVPTARKPIEDLGAGDPNLEQAFDRLLELDEAVGTWRADGSARCNYPFDVSPESTSRIQKGLLNIKDEEGVMRTFSDHCRYGPDENRIHFIVETEPVRHALVGHVGRKIGIG